MVSALTPVAVFAFGIIIARFGSRFESGQWATRQLVERRLAAYERIGPQLNDIFCYMTYVGNWRRLEPPEIIQAKRAVDRDMHVAAPMFSPEVMDAYNSFIDGAFETYVQRAAEARIRTKTERRRIAFGDQWVPAWNTHFSAEADLTSPSEIRSRYQRLIAALTHDFGIETSPPDIAAGEPPEVIVSRRESEPDSPVKRWSWLQLLPRRSKR